MHLSGLVCKNNDHYLLVNITVPIAFGSICTSTRACTWS